MVNIFELGAFITVTSIVWVGFVILGIGAVVGVTVSIVGTRKGVKHRRNVANKKAQQQFEDTTDVKNIYDASEQLNTEITKQAQQQDENLEEERAKVVMEKTTENAPAEDRQSSDLGKLMASYALELEEGDEPLDLQVESEPLEVQEVNAENVEDTDNQTDDVDDVDDADDDEHLEEDDIINQL